MEKNPKRHQNSDADDKLTEAGEWFLRIESESLSSEEMDAFADWIETDDVHRKNLDLMGSVWSAMDSLKDDPLVVGTASKSPVWERAAEKFRRIGGLVPNVAWFRYAVVAVVLILLVGGIWLARDNSFTPETFKAAVGEQKTVYLSDGSSVYIDTDSAVSVHFTDSFRYVALLRGRVYFSVAHDSTRPFIVTADHITARAVGTEFEVFKKDAETVSVAVSKGKVQVSQVAAGHLPNAKKGVPLPADEPTTGQKLLATRSDTAFLPGQMLVPGQQIVVNEKKGEYVLTSSAVDNVGAWHEGRLDFQSKALPEVIEEVNRYLTDKVMIGDDTLNNLNVSVYFKIKNLKDFVATLENTYPITSRTLSNGKVVLFMRE